MEKKAQIFYERNQQGLDTDLFNLIEYHELEEFGEVFKRLLNKKDRKLYYYMVTFTLKDAEQEEKAEAYITGQVNRSALCIERFEYVKELTKKGVPHWHCLIVTSKVLKKDRFNYYTKKYGFVDISRNKGSTDSEILNYMNKETLSVKLK